MAVTWSGTRTKIRTDLWRPGSTAIPDDVVDRSLHSSILELESRRKYLWLENVSRTIAFSVDAADCSCPGDLSTIQSIAHINSSGDMSPPLALLPVSRIRVLAEETTSATPEAYAMSMSESGLWQLFFDCPFKAGDKLELVYTARTNEVLEIALLDQDNNSTLQLHQHIVIRGACADIARGFLRNDALADRQALIFEKRCNDLDDLDDERRKDIYGGGIIPDDGYSLMARGC